MRPPERHASLWLIALLPLLLIGAVAGCGGGDEAESADVAAFTLRERLLTTENAVTVWERGADLAEAHAAAEAAANLVVGSGGPGFGDRDGNGTVEASDNSEFGVLPGLDGTPPGLAELVENECVEADLLGGSWDDPAARWAELDDAVSAWTPVNDTVSALASQPMQVVAWATLALSTDVLDDVRTFGVLAAGNVETSLDAVGC